MGGALEVEDEAYIAGLGTGKNKESAQRSATVLSSLRAKDLGLRHVPGNSGSHSALQSSWIQRLNPALLSSDNEPKASEPINKNPTYLLKGLPSMGQNEEHKSDSRDGRTFGHRVDDPSTKHHGLEEQNVHDSCATCRNINEEAEGIVPAVRRENLCTNQGKSVGRQQKARKEQSEKGPAASVAIQNGDNCVSSYSCSDQMIKNGVNQVHVKQVLAGFGPLQVKFKKPPLPPPKKGAAGTAKVEGTTSSAFGNESSASAGLQFITKSGVDLNSPAHPHKPRGFDITRNGNALKEYSSRLWLQSRSITSVSGKSMEQIRFNEGLLGAQRDAGCFPIGLNMEDMQVGLVSSSLCLMPSHQGYEKETMNAQALAQSQSIHALKDLISLRHADCLKKDAIDNRMDARSTPASDGERAFLEKEDGPTSYSFNNACSVGQTTLHDLSSVKGLGASNKMDLFGQKKLTCNQWPNKPDHKDVRKVAEETSYKEFHKVEDKLQLYTATRGEMSTGKKHSLVDGEDILPPAKRFCYHQAEARHVTSGNANDERNGDELQGSFSSWLQRWSGISQSSDAHETVWRKTMKTITMAEEPVEQFKILGRNKSLSEKVFAPSAAAMAIVGTATGQSHLPLPYSKGPFPVWSSQRNTL